MLKRICLIITLAGIFTLLILLNFSAPIIVDNYPNLEKLTDNTKVQIHGKVISERILYETTKLIKLNNSMEIICNSCPNYLNQTINVIGTTETYGNKTQVNALKIKK
jgi:hypothetical protein